MVGGGRKRGIEADKARIEQVHAWETQVAVSWWGSKRANKANVISR
jgi:hypothetical protein